MSAKKVGKLIKEARTNAGLTQEQLARKVKGASASDISKAERGEKELTQEQLKAIAKATGVTQKSLLEAAKGKTSSSSSSSSSSSTAAKSSMRVTATEKRLVEYYRKADSETKKSALNLLKNGTAATSILGELIPNTSSSSGGILGSFLSGAANALGGKKEMPDGEAEDAENAEE